MGPPDTHLYRMQLEARWAEAEQTRAVRPDPDAPTVEAPARRPLAGLFGMFGRFAKQRVLAPAR
jgi:hypothetical protein